jgi:hypothetical protein
LLLPGSGPIGACCSPSYQRQLLQILAMVMDHDIAKAHFNVPVDVAALGLADYEDVVKASSILLVGSLYLMLCI